LIFVVYQQKFDVDERLFSRNSKTGESSSVTTRLAFTLASHTVTVWPPYYIRRDTKRPFVIVPPHGFSDRGQLHLTAKLLAITNYNNYCYLWLTLTSDTLRFLTKRRWTGLFDDSRRHELDDGRQNAIRPGRLCSERGWWRRVTRNA
jgi:hypothetical protein